MSETKRMKVLATLMLAFAALTLVLVILSFERGVAVMMHYTCPMAFAFAGMTLFSGRCRQADLWVGVAFVAWYVLSRMLMKELYLDYSFSMFSNLCCAYLLAFPFACGMDDGLKKTGLKAVTVIFGIGYGLLAWIGIASALLGNGITLPYLGTQIQMRSDLRLVAGNHPNISACMFMIGLMLGVWLVVQLRRRWLILPVLVLCLGAYIGIALADSRTVMLQLCCFLAGAVFLSALRLPVKTAWKRFAIGVVTGAVCLVLVFVSFDWTVAGINHLAARMSAYAETVEKQVVSDRNIMSDLATMTGRTRIYQNIFLLIQERPGVLLTGMLNSEIVQVLRQYTEAEHAHNSYLQTLLNMGLPGLLMALFFTARAVWVSMKLVFSRKAAFADQLLAVILLVFLVGTIPEPYLFSEYLTAANMPFFLVFGYALETERGLRA